MTTHILIKALVSGALVALVSELAKRDNLLASILHSLPLVSLLTFVWLFIEKKDAELIGRHAFGTFWFVLPTLPMFVLMPWFIKQLGSFWVALGAGIGLTTILYFLTMHLLKAAAVEI